MYRVLIPARAQFSAYNLTLNLDEEFSRRWKNVRCEKVGK